MMRSRIKKIGNSWYIKIPPNPHKNFKLQNDEEILIEQVGRMLEIRFKCNQAPKDAAFLDLKEGLALGPPEKIVREKLYKTDRY